MQLLGPYLLHDFKMYCYFTFFSLEGAPSQHCYTILSLN